MSPRDLATKWTSYKRIRTILQVLKMGALIGADLGAGITIITICNYDKYQDTDENGAQQRAHRIKKGKNLKKIRKTLVDLTADRARFG